VKNAIEGKESRKKKQYTINRCAKEVLKSPLVRMRMKSGEFFLSMNGRGEYRRKVKK